MCEKPVLRSHSQMTVEKKGGVWTGHSRGAEMPTAISAVVGWRQIQGGQRRHLPHPQLIGLKKARTKEWKHNNFNLEEIKI